MFAQVLNRKRSRTGLQMKSELEATSRPNTPQGIQIWTLLQLQIPLVLLTIEMVYSRLGIMYVQVLT